MAVLDPAVPGPSQGHALDRALRVALVGRTDSRTTGLARYVFSLYDQFESAGRAAQLAPPAPPALPAALYDLLRRGGIDLRTVLRNYPVHADVGAADVCHITSQNLATIASLRRLPPTVVTVHDLHFLIERAGGGRAAATRLAERIAAAGLRRADALIAISAYTKRSIVDVLGYPAERISVIHRAVDPAVFRPMPVPEAFRARYGLPAGAPLVLYVGSEDPRKNLVTLVEAFHAVRQQVPGAVLVKAGAVHFRDEAARIRQQVYSLGLEGAVVFIEQLPDADLPLLYNAADIFVIPSLFEGFGLPALEAMACGRPVVAANATSLPEVVGAAGLLFGPQRPHELAAALVALLRQPELRQRLGAAGLARSREFSLEAQANQTWQVYASVAQARQQYVRR